MCLDILKNQKIKITVEDIYTLKYLIVDDNPLITSIPRYYAPIKNYEWILGKKPTSIQLIKQKSWKWDCCRIGAGYYSFDINKINHVDLYDREFFLCKIPKGAKYYQDDFNAQVCSSQLIVIEQIYTSSNKDRVKDGMNIARMNYKQRLQYIKRMIKSYDLNIQL